MVTSFLLGLCMRAYAPVAVPRHPGEALMTLLCALLSRCNLADLQDTGQYAPGAHTVPVWPHLFFSGCIMTK